MDCAGRLWVAISVARSDVWQAPAGARPSLLIMYTSILGAQAAQVVGLGAWAVGELIGAVRVKVMGASYDFNGTKTGSTAQCGVLTVPIGHTRRAHTWRRNRRTEGDVLRAPIASPVTDLTSGRSAAAEVRPSRGSTMEA